MHISEGVLSAPVLAGGAVLAAIGTAIGLKHLDYDRIMSVAMLSAVFFVASLVHVPIGPGSAHLLLNGLLGAVLGWAAFPAIMVSLLLQTVLFQFGGLTTLGVNTFNLAFPAVLCGLACRPLLMRRSILRPLAAFLAGFVAILLTAIFTAMSLALTDEAFFPVAKLLLIIHLPISLIEGCVTLFVVSFLWRVQPEILHFSARS
jgi:cobalt/nickel transport system permease protein